MQNLKITSLLLLLTACGQLDTGTRPNIEIAVGSTGSTERLHELATIIPGSGQSDRIQISIRNVGTGPLSVNDVEMLATNADGSTGNPWVTIDWGGFNPELGFPHTVKPNDVVTRLNIHVVFEPGACEGADCHFSNTATLRVTSDDPDEEIVDLTFTPPECTPQSSVQPPKTTYFDATPVKPETKTFQIVNDGNCETTVNDIVFSKPTSKFTIERAWANGTTLPAANSPEYAPLIFKVKYQPTDTLCEDKVVVQVKVADRSAPIGVQLLTECEEGNFEVSHNCGDDPAKLDFTDVDTGDVTCTVNINNLGPAAMTVQGICMVGDLEGSHYTLTAELPGNPPVSAPTPLCTGDEGTAKSIGLVEGRSLDIDVTYHGSITGLNAELVVNYTNPGNGKIRIPAFGGQPKACFGYAPGDAQDPLVMMFIGSKGAASERQMVIYSCGNADLTLNAFRFEDSFGLGNESKYFSLADEVTFPVVIPAGELRTWQVAMLVEDNELEPDGTAYIDYKDPSGADVVGFGVSLRGFIDPSGSPPTAVPESTGPAVVGQPHELTGLNSTPGSEGIADSGYVWYLTAKPAGSQVVLNGGASGPTATWVPDVAGTYTFALLVHGNSGSFLYSDTVGLDVEVAAAQ